MANYKNLDDPEEEAAMDIVVDGTIDASGALSVIVRDDISPPGQKKTKHVNRGKAKGLIRNAVAEGGNETIFDVIDEVDRQVGSLQVQHGESNLITCFYWNKNVVGGFVAVRDIAAAMQAEIT